MENERLKSEINRLRSILENSPDGAVGGIDISDSNSIGASSTDGAGGAALGPERLEIELKAAKQQVASKLSLDEPEYVIFLLFFKIIFLNFF